MKHHLLWLLVGFSSGKFQSQLEHQDRMTPEFYEDYICKSVGEFHFDPQTPKNREFDFCKEQEGNTCCLHREVVVIKHRLLKAKDEALRLSPQCFEISKSVHCSLCDSDVVSNISLL